MPMIEFTAWPPNAGKPSTSATLRPSRAASSAADRPAMPAPTTQISTSSVRVGALGLVAAHDARCRRCNRHVGVYSTAITTLPKWLPVLKSR